jgi:hypothetical protein
MTTGATSGLGSDWVVAPALDLELKQYILLAYVQRVRKRFAERKLFPYLSDVATQLDDLLRLQREKEALAQGFGELVGFDPRTGSPVRETPPDPAPIAVVDEVIRFAVPGLEKLRAQGLELQHELSERLRLEPVGVQPLNTMEGWILLRSGSSARAYAYSIPLVAHTTGPRMRTCFVASYTMGLHCTYEAIKSDLVRTHAWMPNPAVFAAEFDEELPWMETALPLVKQTLQARTAA